MIYLDSSALLKLLKQEDESDALQIWLAHRSDDRLVSSSLLKIEVLRRAWRIGPDAVALAEQLVQRVNLMPISAEIVDIAAALQANQLLSLDAIHIASALSLEGSLQVIVSYDLRLIAVAGSFGLATVSPY